MNTMSHASTFFLISSIGFIVIFLLAVVALLYVITLLRSVARISAKIEKDIDNIGDTAKDFVMQLWDSSIFSFLFGKKRKSRKIE